MLNRLKNISNAMVAGSETQNEAIVKALAVIYLVAIVIAIVMDQNALY
jgi:hypothetical protein